MILLENTLILFSLLIWTFALIQGLLFKKSVPWGSYTALSIHLGVMIFRLVISGHLPFSNIYESLVFFSFLYGLKLVFMRKKRIELSSLLLLPTIIILFLTLFMPSAQKNPAELMPSLKSFWFYIHVPSIFIGYVSIMFAFVLSFFKEKTFQKVMDNEVKVGFYFLTLGIITGAFWGAQSWSRFWNWDPKEVWALITWLLLLVVLHLKNRKWKKLMLFISFGALLFTYFGVTYILPGLHSYG